ncbi:MULTISPECIES: hypothetical protein [unclassified Endozoicomonas]|uniref:hypothetical protein n=1 Tax=unclassified Endozoicomonas TaxID=2644528 RepID=UPI003BB5A039
MKAFFFILIFFFTQFSVAGRFSDAILGNNFTAIEELIKKGYMLERENDAVSDALNSGSLEMLLFVLKHGASPNSFTYTHTYNSLRVAHILNDASTISEIVALLSFGADPFGDSLWEWNHALVDKRWLHLIIYYYWWKTLKYGNFTAPNSLSELNVIIGSLPFLIINSFVVFMENNLDLEEILPVLPEDLKWLFDFVSRQ